MRRLLICGFGPFPQAPQNPAALAVEHLQREGWSPPGAKAGYAVLPTVWTQAPERALEAARGMAADAILLVGVAVGAPSFRVETLARNHVHPVRPDAEGQCWASAMIDLDGPDDAPVSAPVDAMLSAIQALDLPAMLSDDAGDYLCNFTLFKVLAQVPMTAFLHVPALSADIGLDDIIAAVRAAATAF
jgi:pyroglutamyl-peptidase